MEPQLRNKQGKDYKGYKSCPKWLRMAYLKACGKCQVCSSTQDLEIHRIIRGVEGGLYTVLPLNHPCNNIQVLCKKCHSFRNYSKRNIYK